MDKARITEIFNLGFRRGANDRAANSLLLSGNTQPHNQIPAVPAAHFERSDQTAWRHGYAMGYQIGASDAELSSIDIPGAHGMISGMSEQMLEMFGAFKKMSDENYVA